MDPLDEAKKLVRDALKGYFEQLRFARAAELARSRRYLEAEGLLAPHGRVSADPRDLDLLARISAQQRHYGRARRLWESALQQSPGNENYARAIESTKVAERWQAKVRLAAMVVLAGVGLTLIVFTLHESNPFRRPSPASSVEAKEPAKSEPTPSTPQPVAVTPQPVPSENP